MASSPKTRLVRPPASRNGAQIGDPGQRLKLGRDRRKQLNRSRLGEFDPRKRKFKPVDLLCGAVDGRLASLLPLKYTRMAASPFAFFRGAVSIMAADLAAEPNTGLTVQLCGDAHVQNLGSFEAPDGRLVFDVNDFDETIPGPWEWDVKRMAASIVLAGQESEHGRLDCERAVEAFACGYCETIETLAGQPILVAARHLIHRLRDAQAITAALAEAERAQPKDLLKRYTGQGAGGKNRFKKIPHSLWRLLGAERAAVLGSLALYQKSLAPERLHLFSFFKEKDAAFKVVGTGSVGLRDYVVLMEGSGSADPLFLQIKQEVASAYAPYLKHPAYRNQGQRVAEGQRRIQPVSDLLLGWTRFDGHDFLVRQLNDHKGSVDLMKLRGAGLISLAEVAGELLARGHARSGDALSIKGYIGSFDKIVKAIVSFGANYAAIAHDDYSEFKKAIASGRLKTL
jgi:uncharacterized protein (DUF2252 family)